MAIVRGHRLERGPDRDVAVDLVPDG